MSTANFIVRNKTDKKTKTQHLQLEGDMGISYIEKIKSKIDSINIELNEVIIELKNIYSFDLSTVQLVLSLKKTLVEKGKNVKIVSDMPEDIIPLLKNAGFNEFV